MIDPSVDFFRMATLWSIIIVMQFMILALKMHLPRLYLTKEYLCKDTRMELCMLISEFKSLKPEGYKTPCPTLGEFLREITGILETKPKNRNLDLLPGKISLTTH
jgi:hypothetical protein